MASLAWLMTGMLAILLGTPSAWAVQLELVVGGLSSPVYVTHSRDGSGRLFIVEQGGVVKVLPPGAGQATVFLNITDSVLSGGERGLLGLAFHPQFATNGRLFVSYTRVPDGATVVAEFRALPLGSNTANPDSEQILLTVPQPFANHNGGMIEFGPDGRLYIGRGDGGSADDPMNNAQNPQSLLGKILRIDVDAGVPYAVPPDNPFAQGGGQPEIYALGFRNPFRFSFDRLTGALRVGDVGQALREEIDVVVRGGNYGWKVWEGNVCRQGTAACNASAFVPPVTEYATQVGGRCAVTGGYVYRGIAGSLPSGTYIFGDYCTGEIFQGSSATVLMNSGLNIASFGETAAGEILVVDHGGAVYRLAPDSSPGPATRERTDFNGDGFADILWRNTDGQTYVWFLNGLSIASHGSLGGPGPLEWTIQATGDFNGDGRADILWRNTAGQTYVWFLNGLSLASHGSLGGAGPLEWTIQATGDFNGDGRADILWRNTAGQTYVWFVNGLSIPSHGSLGGAGPEWTIQATGDFNGDGRADILWRNTAGQTYVWFVNGLSIPSHGSLGGAGPEWTIQATGDFNGDGRADILWRNTDGQTYVWFVNGLSLASHGSLGGAGPEWTIQATGDFNGDGRADILWRNTDGQTYVWFVNGLNIASHGSLSGAGPEWQIFHPK